MKRGQAGEGSTSLLVAFAWNLASDKVARERLMSYPSWYDRPPTGRGNWLFLTVPVYIKLGEKRETVSLGSNIIESHSPYKGLVYFLE